MRNTDEPIDGRADVIDDDRPSRNGFAFEPAAMSRPNEDGRDSSGNRGQHVADVVTHVRGTGAVEVEVLDGLHEQTRCRFPATAAVVRPVEARVHVLQTEARRQLVVHAPQLGLVQHSPSHDGLVRHEHDDPAGIPSACERVDGVGQELQLISMGDVTALSGDSAIAVEYQSW
jgi:hypothetical protein